MADSLTKYAQIKCILHGHTLKRKLERQKAVLFCGFVAITSNIVKSIPFMQILDFHNFSQLQFQAEKLMRIGMY